MINFRWFKMTLLVCTVLLSGCICCNTEPEQAFATGGDTPPETTAVETAESSELKPPAAGKSYKEKRMIDAMRGLAYDSGRVEVVAKTADPLFGKETFGDAEEAYLRGRYYLFERNDRVAAIGALTRAVIMAPDNPDYLVDLGRALRRKSKPNEAMAAFNTAMDLAPGHLAAREQVAWTMQMSGDYQAAKQAWLQVLDFNPDHGEAHGRLAVLEYYLEDYTCARESMDRARSLGYELPPQFLLLLQEIPAASPGEDIGARTREVTVGPQVRMDTGGTAKANETTMASIDSAPNEVVGGWNDYREGSYRTGVSVSNDFGQTWTDMLLRPPPAHQGSTEGDPMTCYDNRTGTLWAGGISWKPYTGGMFVARKNPGENSFQDTVMTWVGDGADKGWMAAGIEPGFSDSTRVYMTFNFGCQYSDDMGDSWSGLTSLGSGLGFLPRVGPGGELYVMYWDFYDGVKLRRSFNGGESFGPTILVATRMDPWGIYDGSRFPGIFRVPSLNYLAVDPNSGTLYCIYFDTTNMSGNNYNVDLYFTKSEDQGDNWTTPVVINGEGPYIGDQFFSWIEVDAEGRLHVVYFDSRHTEQDDDDPHGMFDAYYALSVDGGDNFTEYRLTTTSFDSYYSNEFMGDYLGLGVGGDHVYPCYPSTQNGDMDIFTNVITLTTPTPSCINHGDVNFSGDLTAGDAQLAFEIALGSYTPSYEEECAADCNANGEVTAGDAQEIFAAALGLGECVDPL